MSPSLDMRESRLASTSVVLSPTCSAMLLLEKSPLLIPPDLKLIAAPTDVGAGQSGIKNEEG